MVQAISIANDSLDLKTLNQKHGEDSPQELIAWALRQFGEHLVMSTSFGAHSALLLHMVTEIAPNLPIVFLDTGYLFAETYIFAESLTKKLNLNLHVYSPKITSARQEALYGKRWEKDQQEVNQYLAINKVEPMQRALRELRAHAWIAGLRADQTEHRADLKRIDSQDGRLKVHPILNWSIEQVEQYIEMNDLPFHPLYEQGYRSIGDTHSTLPTTPEMDPREGRILGQKKECGIHLSLSDEQNQSLKSSGL